MIQSKKIELFILPSFKLVFLTKLADVSQVQMSKRRRSAEFRRTQIEECTSSPVGIGGRCLQVVVKTDRNDHHKRSMVGLLFQSCKRKETCCYSIALLGNEEIVPIDGRVVVRDEPGLVADSAKLSSR